MSESILSIDATHNPIRASLLERSNGEVRMLSASEFDFPQIVNLPQPALDAVEEPQDEDNANAEHEPDTEQLSAAPSIPAEFIKFINDLDLEECETVVLISSRDYLSLNLELPFADRTSIARVLDMEVQDLVPFDVSEFVLQPNVVAELESSSHNVHVSAVPREHVKYVLDLCKRIGLDPLVLSTATSALAALYKLVPSAELNQNSAVVMMRGNMCYLVISSAGEVLADRVMDLGLFGTTSNNGDHGPLAAEQQIALSLEACRERLGNDIETLYVIGQGLNLEQLTAASQLPCELLELPDGLSLSPDQELSILSGHLVQGDNSCKPLTNFRIGEFAYRPPFKELLRGARALAPSFSILILCLLLSLGVWYAARNYYVDALYGEMRAQIQAVIPNLQVEKGAELETVRTEVDRIREELTGLGSPSGLNPLFIIHQISKIIPSAARVRLIDFKGRKVEVQGEVDEYKTLDKIKGKFEKKNRIFCSVIETGRGSRPYNAYSSKKKIPFTFALELCQ